MLCPALLAAALLVDCAISTLTPDLSAELRVHPCLLLPVMLSICALQFLEIKKQQPTSGVSWVFWVLLLCHCALALQSELRSGKLQRSWPHKFYLLTAYGTVSAAGLASATAASQRCVKANACPECAANYASRLSFWWLTPIIVGGYRRPLTQEALPDLSWQLSCSSLFPRFRSAWSKVRSASWRRSPLPGGHCSARFRMRHRSQQQQQQQQQQQDTSIVSAADAEPTETVVFLSRSDARKPLNVVLLKALLRMFAPTLLLSMVLKVLTDAMSFSSSLLLKAILAFLQGESPFAWQGYACACGMLAAGVLQTCVQQQYHHTVFVLGMQLRTVLTSAVYKKSLRLSNAARKAATSGAIVNLLSVDAFKLQDFATYCNVLWAAPLHIATCLWLLYRELGASIFAGLCVLLLMIPFSGLLSRYLKNFQMLQMQLKDARVKLIGEILTGIRVIKLYAWELAFAHQVETIRSQEISVMRRAAYLNACISFVWGCTPQLVSLATFAVYSLSSEANVLDAEKCFVSLSLFNLLRSPLTLLPMVVNTAVECSVSLRRLTEFLMLDELPKDAVRRDASQAAAVAITDASFSWDDAPSPRHVLDNVTLSFEEGALVAVIGSVGSGKSSLLHAVLGSVQLLSGSVSVRGSLAYVSQEPFIQNLSLRDNVLFNSAMDWPRYEQAIRCCALRRDIELLPGGDLAEIGERGVTLSGGQKARVSLARACYANRDVYLLDDPLSAVDVHVGQHIFEQVLSSDTGCLRHKTRILVTHSLTYLPFVDKIVVMNDGEVSEEGTFRELMQKQGPFSCLVGHFLENRGLQAPKEVDTVLSILDEIQKEEQLEAEQSEAEAMSARASELHTTSQSGCSSFVEEEEAPGSAPQQERGPTGRMQWRVYAAYFRAVGVSFCLGVAATYACSHGLALGANFWLVDWTNDARRNSSAGTNGSAALGDKWTRTERIGILGLLGLLQVGCELVSQLLTAAGGMRAAEGLHSRLLASLLRQAATALPRLRQLLQCYADDLCVTDVSTPISFRCLTHAVCGLAKRAVALCLLNAALCLQLLAATAVLACLQRLFIRSSRQLKRLEAQAKSPIFSHFSETLHGAVSIRAFDQQSTFKRVCNDRVDAFNRCYYPGACCSRWLAVRLEVIGHLIVALTCLFGVVSRDSVSPGLVGLAVIYTLNVTQGLNWLVRMASELETNIVSVERIKEYSELPQEAAWHVENEPQLPGQWPTGDVQFRSFTCSYRPDAAPALSDVSLHIGRGQRVGIVGRTGSGKSTLALALFRVLEPSSGQLLIDGVDIRRLGLHTLRQRVTLIPQDPLLFAGTLRWNLDPFDAHSDPDVWSALQTAHLLPWAQQLAGGLRHEIAEGGGNLSLGERQQLCLARALLRRSRLLVLDEATAAVDVRTDALIQATVREKFRHATIITVAHRLNTVMDYDRIVVLDRGRIVETGSPSSLLADADSVFRAMAAEAGLVQ